MQIYVDADACPVVDIVEKIAKKYQISVTLLCDTNHILTSGYSEVVVVGAGADAVDYKLISLCRRGDIVVTQDYGVAAMALGKSAYAIHQSGKWYTDENIDQMLMERHLNKKARRASHKNHLKGPKKRTGEDDERFAQSFERMVKAAILQFEKIGLKPVIYRHATHVVNKRGAVRVGYTGGVANPQYDYDHRQDSALFLDGDFVQRKLRAMQTSYEKYRELAEVHGGPACIDTFGENPFSPISKPEAYALSETQQKLQTELDNESGQIVNRYIKGDERSFTIIAYPVPEIGGNYEEIFREIVKINTLDYHLYQEIQQTIINTLDTCEWVEVKGRGDNETDLLIHLHELTDPKKQTNFENCVADVNIPVGEVFTSPQLAGTGGILHVKKVYLNGLQFRDLKLVFDCGQVIDYTCSNFKTEEENRKYIEDNILHHHPKIPMGEFAIGTNTTAYVAALKYGIADKLPILIAEKMGPHFAVGDTCYSWAEDTPVYNPDGKEIIARDNEISEMRKDDVSLAYYGCHTDITIPYDELGSIRVIDDEGEMLSIIENGRFVLPGTEELNRPFENLPLNNNIS